MYCINMRPQTKKIIQFCLIAFVVGLFWYSTNAPKDVPTSKSKSSSESSSFSSMSGDDDKNLNTGDKDFGSSIGSSTSSEGSDSCQKYFDDLYRDDPNWNNNVVEISKNADQEEIIQNLVERMRMYWKCPNLDISSYKDFEHRMFTFLNPDAPKTPKKFEGRGIALTLAPSHVPYAKRLIHVIRSMSDMPIEVIHQGDLANNLDLGVDVKIINVRRYLNPRWMFKAYTNKWLPVLFSSFEEVLMMDADVVPFVSPEQLFSLYDGTTLLFKDRDIPHMKISDQCSTRVNMLLPKDAEDSKFTSETMERLFKDRQRNLIDSGVVITNRKDQMPALMAGMMLHLAGSSELLRNCFWGDKEFFWLGHVVMDLPVSVHPEPASILGFHKPDVQEFCATQMSHSVNGRLIWLNGGMYNCKYPEIADNKEEAEKAIHFGFKSQKELKDFYEAPLEFNSLLITDPRYNPWNNGNGMCKGLNYCLQMQGVTRYKYTGWTLESYQKIADLWLEEPE